MGHLPLYKQNLLGVKKCQPCTTSRSNIVESCFCITIHLIRKHNIVLCEPWKLRNNKDCEFIAPTPPWSIFEHCQIPHFLGIEWHNGEGNPTQGSTPNPAKMVKEKTEFYEVEISWMKEKRKRWWELEFDVLRLDYVNEAHLQKGWDSFLISRKSVSR